MSGDFADSGIHQSGDTFEWTFTDAGTYDSKPGLHPNMQATIVMDPNAPRITWVARAHDAAIGTASLVWECRQQRLEPRVRGTLIDPVAETRNDRRGHRDAGRLQRIRAGPHRSDRDHGIPVAVNHGHW